LIYARFKPGSDWRQEEQLPAYEKIKVDQSFNWEVFSIPEWTRFNPNREYLANYAVVAFKIHPIRLSEKIVLPAGFTPLINNSLDIVHKPIPENYSHCELACDPAIHKDKTVRRIIRMTIKFSHHKTILLPKKERRKLARVIDIAKMRLRQTRIMRWLLAKLHPLNIKS